jgi:OFA family oxalate/formate antiporter-like MFS transporter
MSRNKIFYGWYIVAASLVIIILDGLLLYSFGVFLPYLNKDFGLSRAAGSSLFSFRSLIQAPCFILAGRLIDRFDPRAVIFGGGAIAAAGMLFAGIVQTTWQLYISYGFFVGLGDAVLYITCVALISRWFIKRRALAIGIITTGVPLSGLITNPLTAWLIHSFGVRHALFALGGLMLTALMSAFVLRARPEDKNLRPYGEEPERHEEEAVEKVTAPEKDKKDWTALEAISTTNYWLLYSMYFLGFTTFLIIVTQFYNFEIDLKVPALVAAGPPAAIGLGSIIGRTLLSSILAESLEQKKVILICMFAQGSSVILLLFFSHIWAFYLFGFLFGFFYSAWVPIFPTLLGKFYGLGALGTIYGIFGTSYSIAAIGGPLLAGYVHDITGTYRYPLIFTIFCCYIAALGAYFIKAPVRKTA